MPSVSAAAVAGAARMRDFLLNVGGYTGSLPEGRDLMAGLIRLKHSRSPEEVEAVLAADAASPRTPFDRFEGGPER